MEKPWEIIGYESVVSDRGNPGVRLYCQRELMAENGAGMEVGRFYFNPENVKYVPELGQKVILLMRGNYVERVILVA